MNTENAKTLTKRTSQCSKKSSNTSRRTKSDKPSRSRSLDNQWQRRCKSAEPAEVEVKKNTRTKRHAHANKFGECRPKKGGVQLSKRKADDYFRGYSPCSSTNANTDDEMEELCEEPWISDESEKRPSRSGYAYPRGERNKPWNSDYSEKSPSRSGFANPRGSKGTFDDRTTADTGRQQPYSCDEVEENGPRRDRRSASWNTEIIDHPGYRSGWTTDDSESVQGDGSSRARLPRRGNNKKKPEEASETRKIASTATTPRPHLILEQELRQGTWTINTKFPGSTKRRPCKNTADDIAHEHSLRSKICSHYHTTSHYLSAEEVVSQKPRNPLISILDKVSMCSTDHVRPGYGKSNYCEPSVLGTFQEHWYPGYNCRVLTLVGTCNTTVSPPVFNRHKARKGRLFVTCSTPTSQADCLFEIDLDISDDEEMQTFLMRETHHIHLKDQLNAYAVVSTSNMLVPILLVRIWNLSSYGCNQLHTFGAYMPQRPQDDSEVHIFGMSTNHEYSFERLQIPTWANIFKFVDDKDLLRIGYKLNEFGVSDWDEYDVGHVQSSTAVARSVPSYPGLWEMPRTYRWYNDVLGAPAYYPAPSTHDMIDQAMAEESGELDKPFRRVQRLKRPWTMMEAMNVTKRVFKTENPIKQLTRLFNVTCSEVHKFPRDGQFADFLDKYERPMPIDSNGNKVFRHFADKDIRYVIPKEWVSVSDHPGINYDNRIRLGFDDEELQ